MHVRHITIENVRRFGADAAKVELDLPKQGWIVAAGRNGAGKTTFLQVIALGLSGALSHDYADTMFSWLREGAAHARTRLTVVPSASDRLRRGTELFTAKPADAPMTIGDDWDPVHGAMSYGREGDGNRAFAGPWHSDPEGWFAAGYGANRRLSGWAPGVERWLEPTTREAAFATLFRDDASLVQPVRWLMDLDHRSRDPYLKAAEQAEAAQLVKGVRTLLNDGLYGDAEVVRVDSRGLWVRVGGREQLFHTAGAGVQVVTALVVDMLRHMQARFGKVTFEEREGHTVVPHDGVVLIDEADAHLHVSWQQRIGPWLVEHFPNVQFIVTTHSPFICQAATEGGLILLPGPGESGAARIADDALFRRATLGSVDDALLSELFGLEHTWSDRSEGKRDRLARLEARVLTGEADARERAEYMRLRAELPSTLADEVERVAASVDGGRAAGSAR